MLWVLLLAFVSWTFQVMTQDTIWAFVTDAPAQFKDIGSRMMPPAWASVHELWWPLWETLNIATLGTNARNQQWHIANDRPNLSDLIWEGSTNHKADLARGIPLLCSKPGDVKIKRLALR